MRREILPPKFNGTGDQEPEEWLFEVESKFNYNYRDRVITPQQASAARKDFAVNALGKGALRWYMQLVKEGSEPQNWAQFKAVFLRRFGQDEVLAKHNAQQSYMGAKESPKDWADRLQLLYSRAGMAVDAWTARHFVARARPEIYQTLRYTRYTTLQEAVAAAEYVVAEVEAEKADTKRHHPFTSDPTPSAMAVQSDWVYSDSESDEATEETMREDQEHDDQDGEGEVGSCLVSEFLVEPAGWSLIQEPSDYDSCYDASPECIFDDTPLTCVAFQHSVQSLPQVEQAYDEPHICKTRRARGTCYSSGQSGHYAKDCSGSMPRQDLQNLPGCHSRAWGQRQEDLWEPEGVKMPNSGQVHWPEEYLCEPTGPGPPHCYTKIGSFDKIEPSIPAPSSSFAQAREGVDGSSLSSPPKCNAINNTWLHLQQEVRNTCSHYTTPPEQAYAEAALPCSFCLLEPCSFWKLQAVPISFFASNNESVVDSSVAAAIPPCHVCLPRGGWRPYWVQRWLQVVPHNNLSTCPEDQALPKTGRGAMKWRFNDERCEEVEYG